MAILKYKRFAGLHVVCKQCGRTVEVTQTSYNGCSHPAEKQKYKGILRINGQRRTKDLQSKSYEDAVKELLNWKQDLTNPIKFKAPEPIKEIKYDLFTDCILMFSDWLENVNVPRQEQKIRSTKYIKETVEYVKRLGIFLNKNGYDLKKLSIYEVDKFAIGKYWEYLEKKVPNTATFNHNLKALKSFYHFIIDEKGYLMQNPVKKIKLRYENPDPRSINDDDFIRLLASVTEKDSIEVYMKGDKKVSKNRYKPYIRDSFQLAAFCGMRTEEVVSIRYSDIITDSTGKILYVEGTDLKFERAHNWDKTKAKKIVYIPITKELEDLLVHLNYKDNLKSNRFLIDGDETMTRASLAKQMSHSFTFFKRKAGISDNISLKHLRKTFLSKLETQTNLSSAAGYQKTPSVILKNYIDKKLVVKAIASKGFSYYDDPNPTV